MKPTRTTHFTRRGRAAAAIAGLLAAALAGAAAPAAAADIGAGRQKAEQVCAACHGKDGNTPIDPSYPRLAGQHADYLLHALTEYKNGGRKNPIMGGQAKLLSKQDMQNVAAYYESLPGKLSHEPPHFNPVLR